MAKTKIELNSENVISQMNQIVENIQEERELALDRFKRQDEKIETNDEFILQGKHLADFLKIASDRTNQLILLTKITAGIVYKDNGIINSSSGLTDEDVKREIQKTISELDLED